MNTPCQDCPRRSASCHSSCPDYAAFTARRDEAMAARDAAYKSSGYYVRKNFYSAYDKTTARLQKAGMKRW